VLSVLGFFCWWVVYGGEWFWVRFLCVGVGLLVVMSDVYSEYRDSCGRFTVGNPGRPRGSYTWLSGEEFCVCYPFLSIVAPSPCVMCGGVSFRFNVRFDSKSSYSVCCRCNHCNHRRWYKPYSDSWDSI